MLLIATTGFADIGWREHRVDDSELAGFVLRGGDGSAVADLDGDGLPDIVSVHEDSSHLRVAFGTEDPDHWLRVTLDQGKAVEGIEDVVAEDIDRDGRPDLVIAAESGVLAIYFNPERSREADRWSRLVLPGSEDRGSWIRVATADFDDDGRPDVLATNKVEHNVAAGKTGTWSVFSYDRDPRKAENWREQAIGRAVFPINAQPIDVDRDGDVDVVASSWSEEAIYFLENLDNGSEWSKHVLWSGNDPTTIGFMMAFGDLNRDGRVDLVAGTGPRWPDRDQISWFEQPDDPRDRWVPHRLGSIDPDKATGLELADIDGDGRLDLMVGGYSWEPWDVDPPNPKPDAVSGRLAWFSPGDAVDEPWQRHDISRRRRGMYDLFVPVDFNADGRVDFVTTRGNSGEYDGVIWLEYQSGEGVPAFVPARGTDSPEVPLPR